MNKKLLIIAVLSLVGSSAFAQAGRDYAVMAARVNAAATARARLDQKTWITSDNAHQFSKDSDDIYHYKPDEMRFTGNGFKVLNKLKSDEVLAFENNGYGQVVKLVGFDFSNVVDEDHFRLACSAKYDGYFQYITAARGKRVVRVIKPVPVDEYNDAIGKLKEEKIKKQKAELFQKTRRTWKSKDGNFSLVASFVGVDKTQKRRIILLKQDGTEISVDPYKLSRADQTFYRSELKKSKETK